MTNRIHLLVTAQDTQGITRMMQYIGRFYVPYINHTYGTSGSIWKGRYKASLIHDEEYLLACMRYIELNSVRASLVHSPSQYRWSSYRCNGQGKENALLTPHPLYMALGKELLLRQEAYKLLSRLHLDTEIVDEIRAACQTGTSLGNDFFFGKRLKLS